MYRASSCAKALVKILNAKGSNAWNRYLDDTEKSVVGRKEGKHVHNQLQVVCPQMFESDGQVGVPGLPTASVLCARRGGLLRPQNNYQSIV